MSELRVVAALCGVELRRLSRDRVALFFLLVVPFVLILAVGSAFPSDASSVRVGVVVGDRGGVGGDVVRAAQGSEDLDVTLYDDERAVVRDIRLGQLDAGIVVPPGLDRAIRRGEGARIRVDLDPANQSSAMVRNMVGAVVEDRALVLTAARFAEGRSGVDDAEALQVAEQQVRDLARGRVTTRVVGGGPDVPVSGFAFVALGQIVLFMFVNSLAGGASLVEMRTTGVAARSMAAPVRVGDLVAGITVARFGIAFGQGMLIAAVSGLVFGVDWRDPVVLVLVVALFAAVAAGAGVLTGAIARTPDQAPAVGVPLALAMAALGGCFFPLSVAPPAMQVVAKVVTPHAWATDALVSAVFDGKGVSAVWVNLVVLAGFAVLFLSLAVVTLRRRLERP